MKHIKYTRYAGALFLSGILLSVSACSTGADGQGQFINTGNDSVFVPSQLNPMRNIVTGNGLIEVERRAHVGNLSTGNGHVIIGPEAKVNGDINTDNGNVTMENGGLVAGSITTTNGSIRLGDVNVGGTLKTHNGGIFLSNSNVQNLGTIKGHIDINSSIVEGDIVIRRENRHWLYRIGSPRIWFIPHEVIIGANSEVKGDIIVDVEGVDLYVHETARIGNVYGAEVISYSAMKP